MPALCQHIHVTYCVPNNASLICIALVVDQAGTHGFHGTIYVTWIIYGLTCFQLGFFV